MTENISPIIDIESAYERLKNIVSETPLQRCVSLSKKFQSNIFLKREDLQIVRSYKIRGAFNLMSQLSECNKIECFVCASAGNHAQGFAFSCNFLKIFGYIFMPLTTPRQKISQTKKIGGEFVSIILTGDTYDDAFFSATEFSVEKNYVFIPPFNDYKIIEGQGTVALEILKQKSDIDIIVVPVGGGGLISGIIQFIKKNAPRIKIIGVEPDSAPSMSEAIHKGEPISLKKISNFVDGASVKKVGNICYELSASSIDKMLLVSEGNVCSKIIEMYSDEAIVLEPAGVLSVAALEQIAEEIKGKNVVCILSGGNNDFDRLAEIREKALIYEGLKHYFIIEIAEKPTALSEFLNDFFTENETITKIEFNKKMNKEKSQILFGVEFKAKNSYSHFTSKLKTREMNFFELSKNEAVFGFLV